MKLLVGMLVVLGFAASSSFAQSTQDQSATGKLNQSQVNKKKKKKKKKKKATASAVAPRANRAAVIATQGGMTGSGTTTPTTTQPSSSTAPTAQTTTTTVSEATSEAAIKRWTFMVDSWNEFNSRNTNMGQGYIDGYQSLRVGYLLTPTLSASVTGIWENSWGYWTKGAKEWDMWDPYLMLAKTNLLGDLPSGLQSKGYIRYYPGISEMSQNMGTIGMWRGNFTIGRDLSKVVNVSWQIQPRWYMQGYTGYTPKAVMPETGGTSVAQAVYGGKEAPTLEFRLMHFGTATLTLSKLLTFYQNIGMDYYFFNHDPNATAGYGVDMNNRNVNHQEVFYAESGLTFNFTDDISLTAGIYADGRDLLNQTDEFRFYDDANSLYFLDGTVTF